MLLGVAGALARWRAVPLPRQFQKNPKGPLCGVEAWRVVVEEMERNTMNRRLALVEKLDRPEFGEDTAEWRLHRKAWELEVKYHLPQIGGVFRTHFG